MLDSSIFSLQSVILYFMVVLVSLLARANEIICHFVHLSGCACFLIYKVPMYAFFSIDFYQIDLLAFFKWSQ